jgi:acid phosphatase (class A)
MFAGPFLALLIGMTPLTTQAKEDRQGYLAADAVDILKILPPAPVQGEARYEADREIFKATRHFAGSPRWAMAINDVTLSTPALMRDFSCAAGIALTPETAPHLAHLMETARNDTWRGSGIAKDYYKRLRPFQIDAGKGETCQAPIELANSFDYPSGHTTMGWTWAMLLAELVPEHASAVLARGRAFGESRIVCGVHNNSAVEAGRLTASSILAVVHTTPAFQADFAAAKAELAALRVNNQMPQPQGCAEEADLVALPVY